MSKETQNNAPVSAEPVAQYYCKVTGCPAVEASDDECICWHDKGTGPHPEAQVGDIYSGFTLTWRRPKPTAPVAAQPDLTQQTLDDVMAGIPVRDAEIEALRKEIETLRAAQAQQPVSGADRLPIELCGISEAIGDGGGFWRSCSGCHELNEGMATGPFSETFKCHLGVGCSECGGIGAIWDTTDYDAMADFMAAEYQKRTENTEPVGQDQLRDAAQMIEPSGNSGELAQEFAKRLNDALESLSGEYFNSFNVRMAIKDTVHSFTRIGHEELAKLAISRSQQDAEKVDAALADMVHAMFRSANSIPVTRITIDRKLYEAAIDAARKEQA